MSRRCFYKVNHIGGNRGYSKIQEFCLENHWYFDIIGVCTSIYPEELLACISRGEKFYCIVIAQNYFGLFAREQVDEGEITRAYPSVLLSFEHGDSGYIIKDFENPLICEDSQHSFIYGYRRDRHRRGYRGYTSLSTETDEKAIEYKGLQKIFHTEEIIEPIEKFPDWDYVFDKLWPLHCIENFKQAGEPLKFYAEYIDEFKLADKIKLVNYLYSNVNDIFKDRENHEHVKVAYEKAGIDYTYKYTEDESDRLFLTLAHYIKPDDIITNTNFLRDFATMIENERIK